jgi:hypothetical protein
MRSETFVARTPASLAPAPSARDARSVVAQEFSAYMLCAQGWCFINSENF